MFATDYLYVNGKIKEEKRQEKRENNEQDEVHIDKYYFLLVLAAIGRERRIRVSGHVRRHHFQHKTIFSRP